jgi:hypothetical protein
MTRTATIKTDLVFFAKEYNQSRRMPSGTEVWVEKIWKSGTVRLRVKGNLHTRQLNKEFVKRHLEMGA